MDKSGQIRLPENNISKVILFGLIVIVIIALGIVFAVVGGLVKWTGDSMVPQLKQVGNTPNFNMSEKVDNATRLYSNGSSLIPLMIGFLYMVALIGCIGISYAFKVSGERWLIGVYLGIFLLVLSGSILASNFYQDLYEGTGVIALQLQSMTLLSWLVLYSPIVVTVIMGIGGFFMFSGLGEEGV